MILKKDNYAFGFILGLFAPILGFVGFKYSRMRYVGFSDAMAYLGTDHTFLTAALSVSLFANAIIFTYYINSHIDKTAKGIFFATGIYGIAILIIKTFF